ncbi:MAG: RNA polymerase sigma factor [Phenylobacterium sp.]|uniref:RNA polymerase sigma factor n=1 Tax=Phenylobacterium sp. TaxID=1871053 RepID=UPI001A4A6FC4|nr:RNA polymerase sigma factor [Phenylobacterium sp.]MBL8552880.1 RNA polymerase sigma factor [Phenylobacterium sp.]
MSDAEASDAVLARRAAEGDDRAFAVLVRRHKESLYRLLRRYSGDGDEAYEAAHEAFIAAWSALKRYDPSRSFGAWLRTIAINKARDRGRRMLVRRAIFGSKPLDEETEALEKADPAPGAEHLVLQDEQARRLDYAVSRLPGALKEALILTAFEGYSQQEAADMLAVSVKTIETRVYRARKLLIDQLDPDLRPGAA